MIEQIITEGLTGRAVIVLERLKVRTVDQFLKLKQSKIIKTKGCGSQTLTEIIRKQAELSGEMSTIENRLPFTSEEIRLLKDWAIVLSLLKK